MKKIIYLILLLVSMSNHALFSQEARANNPMSNFTNGEIVCSDNIKKTGSNLRKNTEAYDQYILGVFQQVPYVNENGETYYSKKSPVMQEGVCDVKFNSENGAIKKGDVLTSSSAPGVAMKATKSGMIIGVALEDAASTSGLVKIRVLIQYVKQ
jgi:hypothetical protein